MRIIKESRLNEYAQQYPEAAPNLAAWKQVVRASSWTSFADVRQTYRSADGVGDLTVFNIKGNHFRLIVRIDYVKHLVFVRHFLTHQEYDRNEWKRDPWL